jgi:beta-lactamase regulating signal transducer with metallopeptidase domain
MLWHITLTSSILTIFLLLVRRIFLGRINPRLQYAAWALLALRLLIPLRAESAFSAINVINPMTRTIEQFLIQKPNQISMTAPMPSPLESSSPTSVIPSLPQQQSIVPPDENSPQISISDPATHIKLEIITPVALIGIIWLSGVLLLLSYIVLANTRFQRRIRRGKRWIDGESVLTSLCGKHIPILISSAVNSPCLVGIIRPMIILTPRVESMSECLRYVLLHEMTHYRRLDNISALLRSILCAVYWYNPLIWIAAYVCKKDCELACDAAVLGRLESSEACAYGETLISLIQKKSVSVLSVATTMSGGKNTIRRRIKMIAKRPKPLAVTMLCALILTVISVFVACTDGNSSAETLGLEDNSALASTPPPPSPSIAPPSQTAEVSIGSTPVSPSFPPPFIEPIPAEVNPADYPFDEMTYSPRFATAEYRAAIVADGLIIGGLIGDNATEYYQAEEYQDWYSFLGDLKAGNDAEITIWTYVPGEGDNDWIVRLDKEYRLSVKENLARWQDFSQDTHDIIGSLAIRYDPNTGLHTTYIDGKEAFGFIYYPPNPKHVAEYWGFTLLEELPEDYSSEDALRDGCLVVVDNISQNVGGTEELHKQQRNEGAGTFIRLFIQNEAEIIIEDISECNGRVCRVRDLSRCANPLGNARETFFYDGWWLSWRPSPSQNRHSIELGSELGDASPIVIVSEAQILN